jgi:hypothetical protein
MNLGCKKCRSIVINRRFCPFCHNDCSEDPDLQDLIDRHDFLIRNMDKISGEHIAACMREARIRYDLIKTEQAK